MARVAWLLLCGVILCGCPRTVSSDDIDPETIAQLYTVEFDADTNETRAQAVFLRRSSDPGAPFFFPLPLVVDYVELVAPSAVSHETLRLGKRTEGSDFSKSRSVRYEGSAPGFLDLHVFHWTSPDNVAFRNEVWIRSTTVVDPPLVISTGAGGSIEFAPATEIFESVALRVEIDGEDPFLAGRSGAAGSTVLTIDPNELAALAEGEYTARLVRHSRVGLQDAKPAGGSITTETISATFVFTLGP